MKIIQVNTGTFPAPSGGGGGVEYTVHHLSSALAELGHDVSVIDIPDPNRAAAPYRAIEVEPTWKRDDGLLRHVLRGLSFQNGVRAKLRELLTAERYDVVHFHSQIGTPWSISLVKSHGVLAVYNSHSATWCDAQACSSPWVRATFAFELLCFRWCDGLITDSDHITQNLVRHLGMFSEKVLTVPIGLPHHWFQARPVSAEERQRYVRPGEKLILNVARVAPYKNQLALVQAMALVSKEAPEARLVLAGPLSDERYLGQVRRAIDALGLEAKVRLAGRVSPDEHRLLFALADLFVLPSLAESQGLSALEAMAMGKAVVASAIGPLEALLQDGAGVTVPPTDPEALADAILGLLREPQLAQSLAERARRRSLEYRWETIAGAMVDVYQRFLSASRGRHLVPASLGR